MELGTGEGRIANSKGSWGDGIGSGNVNITEVAVYGSDGQWKRLLHQGEQRGGAGRACWVY